MKTRMMIKFKKMVTNEVYEEIKNYLLEEWNEKGIIATTPDFEVQAIILEAENGEIKVIRLEDGRVKTRIKILEKIKKLFNRKNKAESVEK